MTRQALVWYFLAAIVLDHAHLVAPIGLAWSNEAMRQHMLGRPGKFILLPLLIVCVSVWIGGHSENFHVRLTNGALVSLDALAMGNVLVGWRGGFVGSYDAALRLLASVYFVWNAFHFAAQNYGICGISGGTQRQRVAAFWLTVMVFTALPLAMPNVLWVLVATQCISLMHWVMSIRLSGYAARRQWVFTVGILLVGLLIGFVFKVPAGGKACAPMMFCTMLRSAPVLLGLRMSLGIVHFLYDRWVWRRSSPILAG